MCPVEADKTVPATGEPLKLGQQLVMTPQLQMAIQLLQEGVAALHARLDAATRAHPALAWRTPEGETAIGPYPLPRADGVDVVAWRDEADGRWRAEVVPANRPVFAWRGHALPALPPEGAPDEAVAAYQAQLAAARGEPDAEGNDVLWLVRAVAQRARSIARVGAALAAAQADFLCGTAEQPRPLGLREVAEATGMHESTISRVVLRNVIEGPARTTQMVELFPRKPR